MLIFQVLLILSVEIFGSISLGCNETYFWNGASHPNLPSCGRENFYIRGLIPNSTTSVNRLHTDALKHRWYLTGAMCCSSPPQWSARETLVEYADWSKKRKWYHCPNGYFLNGFHRQNTTSKYNWDPSTMGKARCVKPAAHPVHYGTCYNQDAKYVFTGGQALCSKAEYYYMTGFKVLDWVFFFVHEVRCCQMASKPHKIYRYEQLQDHIMATKLMPMAELADALGFQHCAGVKGLYCGEDFELSQNTWLALNEKSTDRKCLHRLKIDYGNWGLEVKNITYGKITSNMYQAETIDSGTVRNRAKTQVTESFEISKTVEDTVIVTLSDSFTSSHEISLSLNFKLPWIFDVSLSYKTRLDLSRSRVWSKETINSRTYKKTTEVTLDPSTTASYEVIARTSKLTVPYTVVVVATFSTQFSGSLKRGRGFSGPSVNYHNLHHGSDPDKSISYRFGDENIPFYKVLKKQRESRSEPWMWSDIEYNIPGVRDAIDKLTDEQSYEFELSGTLEKVSGTKIDVIWKTEQLACPNVIDKGNATFTN